VWSAIRTSGLASRGAIQNSAEAVEPPGQARWRENAHEARWRKSDYFFPEAAMCCSIQASSSPKSTGGSFDKSGRSR
jgi:hypothetical protein